jgi:hypothetical protein
MRNYFTGFCKFVELAAPDALLGGTPATVKSQVHLPIQTWYTTPFPISGVCLGQMKGDKCDGDPIREPQYFKVFKHDNSNVWIRKVPNPMATGKTLAQDQEISLDPGADDGQSKEVSIPRKYFDMLVGPKRYNGADYAGASQNVKWTSG